MCRRKCWQVNYILLVNSLYFVLASMSLGAEENFVFGYPAKDLGAQTFARVDNENIAMQTFEQAVRQAVRSKFYHRQPGAVELDRVRSDVADELIDSRLLGMDAVRRDITVNERAMNKALQEYNKKLGAMGLEVDLVQRKQLLAEQRAVWVAGNVLPELRQSVEASIEVTKSKLEAFYRDNQDKFTQPARQKVSLILLKVSPSAPSAQWREAFKVAEVLHERIQKGEDFASIAKEYSDHDSAMKGGDLGYIHQGMLVDKLQSMVDALNINEVTAPVWTLQGIVLFQLKGRTEPRLLAFEDTRSRIKDLWLKARKKQLWRLFLIGLRKKYADDVIVNQRLAVPIKAG